MIIMPPSGGVEEAKLTLRLKSMPLGELLRYMALLTGMKLDIEAHSIVFRPSWSEGGLLYSKSYSIPPDIVAEAMTNIEVEGGMADDPFADDPFADGDSGGGVAQQPDARDWL